VYLGGYLRWIQLPMAIHRTSGMEGMYHHTWLLCGIKVLLFAWDGLELQSSHSLPPE
jgi:hypothetical protein